MAKIRFFSERVWYSTGGSVHAPQAFHSHVCWFKSHTSHACSCLKIPITSLLNSSILKVIKKQISDTFSHMSVSYIIIIHCKKKKNKNLPLFINKYAEWIWWEKEKEVSWFCIYLTEKKKKISLAFVIQKYKKWIFPIAFFHRICAGRCLNQIVIPSQEILGFTFQVVAFFFIMKLPHMPLCNNRNAFQFFVKQGGSLTAFQKDVFSNVLNCDFITNMGKRMFRSRIWRRHIWNIKCSWKNENT